ncbi:MAG: CHAD domain-containing protein [Alphaproteobacteria bacterium]
METELKLRLAPKDASRLLESAALHAYAAAAPAATERLKTIYFDSPDRRLWQRGAALRMRRSHRRWLQSLKDGGEEVAGLHSRREIEHVVPAPSPSPELLPADLLASLRGGEAALAPVFATEVRRTTLTLSLGDGRIIELALDRGAIRTGEAREPICEAELEVKAGPPISAYLFALELHRSVPFALEHRSKAERGYALVDRRRPEVRTAQPIALEPDMPARLALAAAAAEGLRHLGANEAVAREGEDIEGVHQMRVGLRRLKVVLSLAAKMHPEPALDAMRTELGWLGDVLGKARDLDVFIDETLGPLGRRAGDDADIARLRKRAEKARRAAYVELRTALDSPRYTDLQLRLGAWIAALASPTNAGDDTPLGEVAVTLIAKRHKRLKKFGKRHGWQTKANLHALRLHAKKLRYTAGFFAPLYPHRKAKRFLKELAALQEMLGLAHDGEVAQGLLALLGTRAAADAAPKPGWRRADALVEGWHLARGADLTTRIEAAWRGFDSAKPFW